MTIEIVYQKNQPKEKFTARYVIRQDGKQLETIFALDPDNQGRQARAKALQEAQGYCKTHFQIIPEHRGTDRYTMTTEAPIKAEKPAKPVKPESNKVEPINKKQLKQKLQGRVELPATAVARATPDQSA
jgi:hypothetical protein